MRSVATFAGRCGRCHADFASPLLSDFAYGEAILYTGDGRHAAVVNALTPLAERVGKLVDAAALWRALGILADPIAGQTLEPGVHCPQCGAIELASWGGERVGSIELPEATFTAAAALDDDDLRRRLGALANAI